MLHPDPKIFASKATCESMKHLIFELQDELQIEQTYVCKKWTALFPVDLLLTEDRLTPRRDAKTGPTLATEVLRFCARAVERCSSLESGLELRKTKDSTNKREAEIVERVQ